MAHLDIGAESNVCGSEKTGSRCERGSCEKQPRSFALLILAVTLTLHVVAQPAAGQRTDDTEGGYIDPAVIQSRVRVRYDNIGVTPVPNRAEYLFPALFSIVRGRGGFSATTDEFTTGPLEYEELKTYIELAPSDRFSVFGEFSARFAHGAVATDPISFAARDEQAGAGDISGGLRFGLIANEDTSLTAQFRAVAPAGNPFLCLGTGHSSVEAGLLYQQQVSDRLVLFGELLDWQAINSSRVEDIIGDGRNNDFEGQRFGGNVLRYGVGAGYDFWVGGQESPFPRVSAVGELVGWSVLDGLEHTGGDPFPDPVTNFSDPEAGVVRNAAGVSIVNLKLGVRAHIRDGSSFYVGYGFPLTGEVWYDDIVRLEYSHPLGAGQVGRQTSESRILSHFAGNDFAAYASGGSIDNALIHSRVRVRYDVVGTTPFGNRAEYLFPAPRGDGRGATSAAQSFQELRAYVEVSPHDRFSFFAEFPARFVDNARAYEPVAQDVRNEQRGAGDISAGLRFGIIARDDQALTAQVRAVAPSGDPGRDLGTGHTSIEAGLLYQQQLTDRCVVFGEVLDWQAINAYRVYEFGDPPVLISDPANFQPEFEGQPFGGNVLRYGLGTEYELHEGCDHVPHIAGVAEFVGWTVLDGLKVEGPSRRTVSDPFYPVQDATGDTIVNLNLGGRCTWRRGSSFYIGYGFPLTGQIWSEDILRMEFSQPF